MSIDSSSLEGSFSKGVYKGCFRGSYKGCFSNVFIRETSTVQGLCLRVWGDSGSKYSKGYCEGLM